MPKDIRLKDFFFVVILQSFRNLTLRKEINVQSAGINIMCADFSMSGKYLEIFLLASDLIFFSLENCFDKLYYTGIIHTNRQGLGQLKM